MTQSSTKTKPQRPPKRTLADAVAAELDARRGMLQRVATETDISYDTVLNARANVTNVGFRYIQRLADYLGIHVVIKTPKRVLPPASEG